MSSFNYYKNQCVSKGGKDLTGISADEFIKQAGPWDYKIALYIPGMQRIDWKDENNKGWFKAEKLSHE